MYEILGVEIDIHLIGKGISFFLCFTGPSIVQV